MARRVLERETRTLRKAEQQHSLRRDSRAFKPDNEPIDHTQPRRNPGLVVFDGSEKAVRVPGATRRIGRRKGDISGVDFGGEAEDVAGIGATPVHENGTRACLLERGTGPEHGLVVVRFHFSAGLFDAGSLNGVTRASIRARWVSSHAGSFRCIPSSAVVSSV